MQAGFSYDCAPSFMHLCAFDASLSTGKERDTESGLDYFGARYLSSDLGRWMSPDPKPFTKNDLIGPQKWNKYNYVQDNPLLRFDPNGMDDYVVFRTETAGFNQKLWGQVQAKIEGSKDSQGRQNTFHMVEGNNATLGAWNKALTTKDTHAVFIGHADEDLKTKQTVGIILAGDNNSEGKLGGTVNTVPSSSDPLGYTFTEGVLGTPPIDIQASSVAIFACDSASLTSQYDTTDFTGVQSGPDGTDLGTLDTAAAYDLLGGGGQDGADAANVAIDQSQSPTDTGDYVENDPPANGQSNTNQPQN